MYGDNSHENFSYSSFQHKIMKPTLSLIAALLIVTGLNAQEAGFPPNPEPGQCYVRCITPDVWGEEEVKVLKTPEHTKLEVVPAEYKTVEEQIIVKPATTEYVYIPAAFETVEEVIETVEPYNNITVEAAAFVDATEDVEVQASYASFEYQVDMENCDQEDPRDCMVLCYVNHPAEIRTIAVRKMTRNAEVKKEEAGQKTTTITKQKLVSESRVEEVEVPAVTKTITKQMLVKDETVREITVPAEYVTETRRVLEKKGGLAVWEPIDCELTDYNVLPIFYELNSARLTAKSKQVIDDKLLALMNAKPLISVEINAHTDSRGNDSFNMNLSQRRAQSVVDYLVAKGIDRDRLIAKGYGETRLTNNCKDGVSCSEEEHQKNRRTEFRVVSR